MKIKVARMVTVIVTSAAMAAGGVGMATAAPADRGTGTASTSSIAATIQGLQEQLANAVKAADVSAVTGVLDKVEGTVTGILGAKQFAKSAKVRTDASKALDLTNELQGKLAKARGVDPLGMLNGLIQSLLETLAGLVDSVLGAGLPVPIPEVPGVPEVPGLPEVPGAPDAPGAPEVPGLPPAPLP